MEIKAGISQLSHGLEALFAWALLQVRQTLPEAIRRFGSSKTAQLVRLDENGEVSSFGTLYTSILGETEIKPFEAGSKVSKTVLNLAEADQYRRKLSLSHQALQRGRSALALRLNELSPFPPDDAVFDYRILGRSDTGRVDIEVSIARRARIAKLSEVISNTSQNWAVVGDVDDKGVTHFSFAQDHNGFFSGRGGGVVRSLFLVLAILFACLSWLDRSSREGELMEARRVELLQSAHQLRDVNALIATADRARLVEANTPYLEDILSEIREFSSDEQYDFDIGQIRLVDPGKLTIWGFETDADGNSVRVDVEMHMGNTP